MGHEPVLRERGDLAVGVGSAVRRPLRLRLARRQSRAAGLTRGGRRPAARRAGLAALALIALAAPGHAEDAVDRYLEAELRRMHVPGAALAVVRDGRVVKARGYGLASVELGVAATPDTVFEIGSITKQFTGAAVALLAAEGKLSPADPIAKHLDGVPEAWRGITVEHLLTHSSGIRNYLDVPGMFEETTRAGVTHDSVARMMVDRLPLEFAPGETWTYSNSGYLLLGRIAEKASGQDYWRLLDDRIFRPLGMHATRSSDPSAVVPGRADGYAWTGERLERRPALAESAFAAGSIVSTVLDLAKWDAGLVAGRPLDAATLERLWTPRPAAGGAPAPFAYGYGWFVDTRHGRRVVLHDGGTPGFSSVIYRAVDDRTTVILLTNHADIVLEHLAVEIAGLYVPSLAAPPTAAQDPDPARTRRVEAAVRGLLAGAPDREAFTPAMQSFLRTPTSAGLWQWVAGGRLPESFRYGEEEETKDGRVVRYRAVLGGADRWFAATLAPDGRIARVCWW